MIVSGGCHGASKEAGQESLRQLQPIFTVVYIIFKECFLYLFIPDPVAVLEQAIQAQKRAQRVSDLEIENKQLRETLDDYNNEFAEVKNQGKGWRKDDLNGARVCVCMMVGVVLSCPSVCLSIVLSIRCPVCPSVRLSAHASSRCAFWCHCMCVCVCKCECVRACLSVCLSACLHFAF